MKTKKYLSQQENTNLMPKIFKYQVSSIKYQVSSIKYQVSSIKYQVSSIKYQLSTFNLQPSIKKSLPLQKALFNILLHSSPNFQIT